MPKLKTKRGLTLIELLIAITLVGILAGIISFAMIGQQRKARDAKRKNDLQQVKRALESAKNDCLSGSYYPIVSGADTTTTFNNTADHLLATKYMDESVRDPKNTSPYRYQLTTDATLSTNVCPDTSSTRIISGTRQYLLRVGLEITNDPDSAKSFTKCGVTPVVAGEFIVCPD